MIKPFFWVFAAVFAAVVLHGEESSVALTGDTLNFKDARYLQYNPAVARPSADGRTLQISLIEGKWANAFRLKPGLLKPNTNYVIEFNYQLESPMTEDIFMATVKDPRDPFFHFGVRSANDVKVVNPLRFRALSRQKIARTERVFIPATADDFIFHCDIYGEGGKGEVDNLRIFEAVAEDYRSLFAPADVKAAGPVKIPLGATPFEVALPNNPGGEVVDAAKFGVSADAADNTAAVRQALDYCRKVNAAKLILPRGTLRFGAGGLAGGIVMNLENFRDFELDGNGALLLFWTDLRQKERGEWGYFMIKNSERIRLRNFTVDWDWERDPIGAMVKAVKVNGDEVDFEFADYKDFPRKDLRIAEVRRMDPATRSVLVEDTHHHHYEFYNGKRVPQITWLSGNTIRVKDNGGVWEKERMHLFQEGAFYRLLQYYYDARVFHNFGSADVTLEDINVRSVPGFMMQSRDLVKNWQLVRVRVAPPAGHPERVVTCTADTYDHERGLGNMKMIDCFFTLGHDDAMNMLEFNYPAVKTGEYTLRTRNLKTSAATLRPGDPIRIFRGDWSPTGVTAKLKSLRPLDAETQPPDTPWVQYDRKSWELTLDTPVPDSATDLVLVNLAYQSGNVFIQNCTFDNIAGRGFVMQISNATIENCHYKLVNGLHFRTGYTFRSWTEGAGVDNVVVRNCTFESIEPSVWDSVGSTVVINGYATDQSSHTDIRPAAGLFSNILFENNTFIDTYGMAAYISSADNVIFRNNTFIEKSGRIVKLPYRGSFMVTNAKDIYILNNNYVKSPYLKDAGVYFDSARVQNLVIDGNTLR